ncbi:phage antirepressor KilAC domain-containing protein [Thalassobius sp. Cn5-15]|uniref:phage antirepressor KilAC domain-containing protein n=1 Tax=Thalassobius sp. Cn5-15 TaxID=2917763 RepID=UPI001EF1FC07|nr:phage antirepressor KilAC domain-containing protein [Thalassobius sp. Cn5-15]MCG7492444.1 phage antirepressor KilAC domain-containing protein [Thalassobius sp. Cn5-15]
MNDMIFNTAEPLTMSSKEIADLLDVRHDNVKRTIETLVNKGVIVRPQTEDEQIQDVMGRGRTMSVYLLEKRDSYVVVAQLSPEFTARVVDRWQELEAKTSLQLPNFADPAAAARAWADQVEENKALALESRLQAEKIQDMQDDVGALNRIARAEGGHSLRAAAKILQVKERQFISWMHEHGWIYRPGNKGAWLPYSDKTKAGLMTVKTFTQSVEGGDDRSRHQALVTPKGLTRLGKIFSQGALDL